MAAAAARPLTAEFLGGFSYGGVARLKPGITAQAAQRDFASVLPRMAEVTPMLAPGITTQMMLDQAKPVPRIVPMREDIVGGVSRTLWIVAAAALLVLLVTCANVANLLLVRADARHRELSVRSALGASRGRVMMHFFTETAVLTVVSSLLGLAAAYAALRFLVATSPANIPRLNEIRVDATVVGFTLIVAALVAVACSAIPAIRFMRSDTLTGLRDGGRGAQREAAGSVRGACSSRCRWRSPSSFSLPQACCYARFNGCTPCIRASIRMVSRPCGCRRRAFVIRTTRLSRASISNLSTVRRSFRA